MLNGHKRPNAFSERVQPLSNPVPYILWAPLGRQTPQNMFCSRAGTSEMDFTGGIHTDLRILPVDFTGGIQGEAFVDLRWITENYLVSLLVILLLFILPR